MLVHIAALIALPILLGQSEPAQVPAHPRELSVLDFGAKGDGDTDDTAAFQKALDAAAQSGTVVVVPAGEFMIRGHLTIPTEVTLEGMWRGPARGYVKKGSVLLAVEGKGDADGTPFISMNRDSTLRGMVIHYPEQIDENPPLAYPWTVRGNGENNTVVDVLMTNPYQAIDFGTNECARHLVSKFYAQALYRGIWVDQCYDIGRIEDAHIWPFWKISEKLMGFSKEKGVAFVFGKTDWEMVSNSFCISYNVGFLFKEFKHGPGNVMITQSGSDIGPGAVRVESSQTHAGVTFNNCQFMAGVEVMPSNTGPVKFTASGFWPIETTGFQAQLAGKGQVFFEGCHFSDWDMTKKGVPCIQALCEGLTVTGCDFMAPGKKQISLDENVQAAIITSNRLRGGAAIDNASKGDVQIGLNAAR
jgi:hypothetical protein